MSAIGLDLSLTSTGIAAVIHRDGKTLLRTTRVQSSGRRNDDLARRRKRLGDLTASITRNLRAAIVVVEGPSFAQANPGSQHDRAGLWWSVVGTLMDDGIAVAVAPPSSRAKWATGKGNADKTAVTLGLARLLPSMGTLNTGPFDPADTSHEDRPPEIGSNDEADAAVLALIGLHALGDLPKAMRTGYRDDALLGVAWPDRDTYNQSLSPYATAERVTS